jgi:hypothetical protein
MDRKYCLLPAVLCCTFLLLVAAFATPVTARGTTISEIQPGDTIFVYETGLDLTALRNATTDNPVTELRRYNDDDPKKGLINTVPVPDDTNFDLDDASVGGYTGLYFASNARDGITSRVYIRYPEVSIEAVLAAPNHAERIEGISVPMGTEIAFRVISPEVGTYYAAGTTRAAVELVLTTPGGAEMTSFGGHDFSNLLIDKTVFYTDDPGMPGPVALEDLEQGTYKVQARWTSPQGFADEAEDSNVITFSVGTRVGVETTPTPSPTTAPPTTSPTTTVVTTTTPVTTATTPSPTTAVTTETTVPVTTMTQASGTLIPALGAAALLLFALRRR